MMSVSVRLPSDQAALARTLGERSSRTVRMALAVSATNITSWESEKSAKWRARSVLTAEPEELFTCLLNQYWLEWRGGRLRCCNAHVIPLWDRGRECRHQEPSLLPLLPRSSRYTSAQAISWYTEPESCPSEIYRHRNTWGNSLSREFSTAYYSNYIHMYIGIRTSILHRKVKITFHAKRHRYHFIINVNALILDSYFFITEILLIFSQNSDFFAYQINTWSES